jgi:hypothetical protein
MKKFFAMVVCSFIMLTAVVGATSENAKTKFETSTAISFATAGMLAVPRSKGGDLAKLREKYGPGRVIANSYIRMEAYLENGKAEYSFSHRILGTEVSTERKLNDQDGFLITDLGIFLLAESKTIAGIGVLQTYPNPIQFPDGAAGGVLNAHLEHLYNGFFSAKIGDTTWLPDQPVFDCRVVNTAQQSALATNDSERRPGDGFVQLQPKYFLKGRENNELKLIVPANSAQFVQTLVGDTYRSKVVCILAGYKVTGAGNTM